jgi:hypothetical protein
MVLVYGGRWGASRPMRDALRRDRRANDPLLASQEIVTGGSRDRRRTCVECLVLVLPSPNRRARCGRRADGGSPHRFPFARPAGNRIMTCIRA